MLLPVLAKQLLILLRERLARLLRRRQKMELVVLDTALALLAVLLRALRGFDAFRNPAGVENEDFCS